MHITQLAYYVADARSAAGHWVATHSAGPFFLAEHIAPALLQIYQKNFAAWNTLGTKPP